MSEYLTKEEIKQWRSSLEKMTLEEFSARLGKQIEEYISKMERNNKKEKLEAKKSKYELSKKINICLSIILFISLILNLI